MASLRFSLYWPCGQVTTTTAVRGILLRPSPPSFEKKEGRVTPWRAWVGRRRRMLSSSLFPWACLLGGGASSLRLPLVWPLPAFLPTTLDYSSMTPFAGGGGSGRAVGFSFPLAGGVSLLPLAGKGSFLPSMAFGRPRLGPGRPFWCWGTVPPFPFVAGCSPVTGEPCPPFFPFPFLRGLSPSCFLTPVVEAAGRGLSPLSSWSGSRRR